MNVILSDEQKRSLLLGIKNVDYLVDNVAKRIVDSFCQAQAHHLLKLLQEPCTEHLGCITKHLIKHRYQCPICMSEIEKEIGK